ncbi:hypothetical protein [Thaumasiovibrio subtropicus]|uniref:hypothetical protein n=1 Tax=Thaumasiovibrio subtropicus TaxID=1891207 RepID=UPI00131D2298|nr:hypothetical protein [Thaumasiovibrio subtropicus]
MNRFTIIFLCFLSLDSLASDWITMRVTEKAMSRYFSSCADAVSSEFDVNILGKYPPPKHQFELVSCSWNVPYGDVVAYYDVHRYGGSCPSGDEPSYPDTQCNSDVPFCDLPETKAYIESEIDICLSEVNRRATPSCDNQTRTASVLCEEINGGDNGTGDNSGGGDTGDGGSGGDSGAGDGDGTGSDGGTGDTGGGSEGDGGSGSDGGADGGSGGDTGSDDFDRLIDAVNANNKQITEHLGFIRTNQLDELLALDKQYSLVDKYFETYKTSASHIEHMANFTEQELAVLKDIRGQFGTHFDHVYKHQSEVITLGNENLNALGDVNDSVNQQTVDVVQAIEAIDPNENLERIDASINTTNEKVQELIDNNQSGFASVSSAVGTGFDELIEVNREGFASIASGAVDLTGVEQSLDSIEGNIDALANLKIETSTPCQEDFSSCKGFYTSVYPNGYKVIFTSYIDEFKSGEIFSFLDTFKINLPNHVPSWRICFNLGFLGNFGCHELSVPDSVWGFIRIIIIITSVFVARMLVFGG